LQAKKSVFALFFSTSLFSVGGMKFYKLHFWVCGWILCRLFRFMANVTENFFISPLFLPVGKWNAFGVGNAKLRFA